LTKLKKDIIILLKLKIIFRGSSMVEPRAVKYYAASEGNFGMKTWG